MGENRRILAIDTANKSLSVALLQGDMVLAEEYMNNNRNHAPYLVPMIEKVLQFTDTKISDIDLFATTIGPGSFTGLRIAIATLKGLADTLEKPMYGVVSLEALAYNLLSYKGIIVPIMDARKSQVYGAIYDNTQGKMSKIWDFSAFSPVDEVRDTLMQYDEIAFIGDAVATFSDQLLKVYGDKVRLFPSNYNGIRAGNVGLLANAADESCYVHDLAPFYLRGVDAKPKYTEYINE